MKRIQRKRTRGWKMPEGAKYIGRPTKWGNPYEITDDRTAKEVVQVYATHLLVMRNNEPERYEELIAPLRGKDLACWCKEGAACHGDILLKLANEEQVSA